MLSHLSIKNYTLIDDLQTGFPAGMITVTGETGAGKSIILGALKLVLGERADTKSLKNPDEKSVIEAEFHLDKHRFPPFFKENDLDFEAQTLIRREIQPSGKSRAFINDTPVTLDILQQLSSQLIDIHSQFETSDLLSEKYQLRLLDNFSGLQQTLKEYQSEYEEYIKEKKQFEQLKEKLQTGNKDFEYNQFLLNELNQIDLDKIDFPKLEEEANLMKNSEYLVQLLSESRQILEGDEVGISSQIYELNSRLSKGSQLSSELQKISERTESLKWEIQDISSEIENLLEKLEFDPLRYETVNEQINKINFLLQKHQVQKLFDLIEIKNKLETETSDFSDLEGKIKVSELRLQNLSEKLSSYSHSLHNNRLQNIPILENKILETLIRLGMEKSQIKIELSDTEKFTPFGTDQIRILFTANLGKEFQPIAKAISGGERSRVMLAIKKLMAENEDLPTLILDEIDTGVSGRIANEMGRLMSEMGKSMQLIVITHLPQIAAKGNAQFKVEKGEKSGSTFTQIRQLDDRERVEEIAQLISGESITENAVNQAKELFD
ncbi:MAG: DNA repair protein RecN [Flavobacteriaceae bacterium]|jgi:DNA repair protein RecN (Recombination protein N)|nr:DNA repair protein RecN [Flavobacteriaceae bacterium]